MGTRMRYTEIVKQYPDEYILLENPETDEQLRVVSGELLCHSKSRDEVDAKALELRPRHSAFLFTGKPSKDLIVIL